MATTALMTAEELLELPDDGRRFELVRGALRVMAPVNFEHLEFVGWLQFKIGGFVYANGLGVIGPEGGFVLARRPDIVLAPDLAFVRADRLPAVADRLSYAELAPDLAIEVLSPSNRAQELVDKVLLYLEAGTALVWVFDPQREAVAVHTPGRISRTLRRGDTLDGGDVLPGLSLPVADLFDRPGKARPTG